VEAAEDLHSGEESAHRREIFPAWNPAVSWAGPDWQAQPFRFSGHFRYVVFKNPEWDWRALNFDRCGLRDG
jgi:hypothetical protein